jgi:hypothetical protein
MSRLRLTPVALLVAATALFAVGAIALIAFAWAALDIREAAHHRHSGIAIVVAALHLAAAATAALLATRARDARRPGTMPA